jgi:hypothetical protein
MLKMGGFGTKLMFFYAQIIRQVSLANIWRNGVIINTSRE